MRTFTHTISLLFMDILYASRNQIIYRNLWDIIELNINELEKMDNFFRIFKIFISNQFQIT
jgi:hypothetical protein